MFEVLYFHLSPLFKEVLQTDRLTDLGAAGARV